MYILEGNIGAGKSTFLRLLGEHFDYLNVVYEPTQNWNQEGTGKSLLANFYQDPKRWAFTMETLTMLSRIKDHLLEQQKNNNYNVMERSIYSGYYCFAKNGYKHRFLTELEWHIHNQWFDFLVNDACTIPHGFIYLRTASDVAYERVKKRNRSAEETIPLDYLEQISQRHDELLIKKEGVIPALKNVPVLVLNVNEEFESNRAKLLKHFEKVEEFLLKTSPMKEPTQAKDIAL